MNIIFNKNSGGQKPFAIRCTIRVISEFNLRVGINRKKPQKRLVKAVKRFYSGKHIIFKETQT